MTCNQLITLLSKTPNSEVEIFSNGEMFPIDEVTDSGNPILIMVKGDDHE